MLRSILVALDATAASEAAQALAIGLAARFECQITGLAVLDRSHITAPSAVGIGGSAYKRHRDQVKLEEAKAFLTRLEHGFEKSCEAIGTAWHVIEAEGVPHRLIEEESGRHDLLVIGKDTDFHLDVEATPADVVRHLLRDNPRPLIVCPEQAPIDGLVLVAYDGSVRSSRALHMLALLGIARSRPIHVVSIAHDQDTARRRASYATELFAKHDHQIEAHGVASGAAPAEIVLAEVNALKATLVVMGASGDSPIHDFFLGSTTKRLLGACPCPLFVHH